MGIEVTGLRPLMATITKYSDLLEDLTPSLQTGIEKGADHARSVVPVDTGYLQSTIYGQVNGPNEAEMGATAEYAAFVEFGTIHMAAQPYIEPGSQIALQSVLEDIRQRTGAL